MNREFLINLIFLITINLIIKPFYVFGIDLKVQNAVENYGLYFALLNFSYIFQIFSDLGIYQYNNRNIAQHEYLFEKYFGHLLVLKMGLGGLFLLLSFGTALLLGYRGYELYLLLFLLVNQIFITLTFFFRSNISGLQNYRLDSLLSVLDKVLMILICIPLLWTSLAESFKIEWFIYAQSTSFGLTAFVSYWFTRRYLKGALTFYWNTSLLKAILKQSIPFSLVVLLMSIYTRIDAVMIERLLPEQEGNFHGNIYAAAYRLLDAINMVCYLFAGLLLPMFAKMLKQKIDIQPLLKLSISVMLVITFSFSIAVCYNASHLMALLYDNYNPLMDNVLILLMLGFNAIGVIHIVGTLLTANGSLFIMNVIFTVGIFINISLNYFLIFRLGALGAACSSMITQIFVAIAEIEIVRRTFKISWSTIYCVQIITFVLGIGLINYGLQQIEIWWFSRFVLAGVLSLVWAYGTKILDAKRILSTFKTKTI